MEAEWPITKASIDGRPSGDVRPYGIAAEPAQEQSVPEYSQIEAMLKNAKLLRRELDDNLDAVFERSRVEMRRLDAEIDQLDQMLAEHHRSFRHQTTERLRREFSLKLEEAARIKSQLQEDFQRAFTEWETERHRLNLKIAEFEHALPEAHENIRCEVSRTQALIIDLATTIEDPETDLSTVIRKNLERNELEAYLKGIRYVLEQTQDPVDS